jgi:hypothetical protein
MLTILLKMIKISPNGSKEGKTMRTWKIGLIVALVVLLAGGSFSTLGWAQQDPWTKEHDPLDDEYNMLDLFFARPGAALAGVAGTVFFIVTLPFTIPTNGVEESADMFINRPFRFAFEREFPDEDIRR